ncbi:hypothetical protein CONLIGDRAFT_226064 [Coniochaeta ligniaria NRRL 30616]|uniref:Uncharacterized protein n=1 Tax=Coniochaeta ligniaria NRRL 30616 TaxID=1408157 RepID=A0A1J7I3X5_9PEZI|nr:hypothetical protein CONLIGDRAFT_226064 [Coniochaeta ligniaria NRRL 30616]
MTSSSQNSTTSSPGRYVSAETTQLIAGQPLAAFVSTLPLHLSGAMTSDPPFTTAATPATALTAANLPYLLRRTLRHCRRPSTSPPAHPLQGLLSRRVNMTDYATAKEVVERVKGTAITGNEPQSQRPFTVSQPLPLFNKSA